METTAKKQRRRAHRKPVDSSVIRLEMKDRMGNPRLVTAEVLDVIGGGFGLALTTPLKSGSTVTVTGKLGENRAADNLKAGVRWCIGKTDGTFRAGLEFLDSHSTLALDCYEVMQLSPNAEPETISRVYRMLASRYHPDNAATGNSEKFLQLSEVYKILSDPEKRASYDRRYRDAMRLQQAFDQASASTASAEKRSGFDIAKDRVVKVSDRVRAKGGRFSSSVGELRGWNTALR